MFDERKEREEVVTGVPSIRREMKLGEEVRLCTSINLDRYNNLK